MALQAISGRKARKEQSLTKIEPLIAYEDAKEVDPKAITQLDTSGATSISSDIAVSVIRRAQGCFYYDDGLAFLDPNAILKLAEAIDEDDDPEFGEEELDRGFWLQHFKLVEQEAAAVAQVACVPADPSAKKRGKEHIRSLLNLIVPPKEWTSGNGKTWRQLVSSSPGTFEDLSKLQNRLDMYLKQFEAKETGLCPVRHYLYSQVFDELIRQVALACLEQGVLMLRVRNDVRDTVGEYKKLYASSTSFKIRRELKQEVANSELIQEIRNVEAELVEKRRCLEKLKEAYGQIDERNVELFEQLQAKHERQSDKVKRENKELKSKLESIILPRRN